MNNETATKTNSVRNTIIAATLALTLAVPVTAFAVGSQEALATNGDSSTSVTLVAGENDDVTSCDSFECISNEEYVNSLIGLTDAEKQELIALYDKWDALADDEELSDADWQRMCALEDKAWYADMEDCIKNDTAITDDQRATYLKQLDQMKELDAYFESYFNDPTYLEMCEQYNSLSESLGSYLGWDDCYDCYDLEDAA